MSIDRTRTIEWDGKALSDRVVANGTPTNVSADRDTVQTVAAGFNDAHTGGTNSADVATNLYLPSRWNWGPAKSSIDWH